MAEEVKDKKKVGQDVETPAQLASESTDPYQEVFEESQDKGGQTQQTEEPTDQRERSNLGRRVRKMEDKFDTFISKFETYLEGHRTPAYQSLPPPDEEEDEEFIRKMNGYERKRANEQRAYEDKYLKATRQLAVGDADFKEIHNIMMNEFNVRHSNDPELDAELNYSKAQAAFLRKQRAGVKPNVRGERTDTSADLSISTKTQTEESTGPELDDFAKEYVSKIGMKDESVKEAFKGEPRVGIKK